MIRWQPVSTGWWGYDGELRVAVIECLPRWDEPMFAASVIIVPHHVWAQCDTVEDAKAYCETLYRLEAQS